MSSSTEKLPTEVLLRELGPREGFQIHPVVVPTAQKLELITQLTLAGLKTIEVTSFVRPDRVPQLADAEQVVAGLPKGPGRTEYTALYLNQKGFQRAESTGVLSNLGWLYTAASNSFLEANSNVSIDTALGSVPEWLSTFASAGKSLHGIMVSTAFGCEIEGDIRPSAVVSLVERYLSACAACGESPQEVCLADTVGRGSPGVVRQTVRAVRSLGVAVSLHLHDTRGLGLANVYAGLLEGVAIFESSVGGVGGCPFTPGAAGNVPTEEIVHLCDTLGIKTGVDLLQCCKAARVAEKILGSSLPGKLYKVVRS